MSVATIKLNSGYSVPVLGLGTWKADPGVVAGAVTHALTQSGYTHIDCAKVYGNEKEIGTAFNSVFSAGNVARESIFITSKLWNSDHDPAVVEQVCRQTLADLQLEYLDLYLMHWGIAFAGGEGNEPRAADGSMKLGAFPLHETWKAMELLVDKGLVRSIGVSNFSVTMLTDMLSYARIAPAMNQVELHPYNTQDQLVSYCHAKGVAVTGYSPLGNKSRLQDGEPALLEDSVVLGIATELQKTPAQVLLRWAIQRGTIVIPKSVTPERIAENIDVFSFELSDEQMQLLSGLNQNKRFVEPSGSWGIPYFS